MSRRVSSALRLTLERWFVLALLCILTAVRPAGAQTPAASLTIDTPPDAALVHDLSSLSGSRDTTIILVEVAVRRESDGAYWNGAAWQGGVVWKRADLNAQGWTFNAGPSTPALTHDALYRVAVRGRRSQQAPIGVTSQVQADVQAPSVTIFSLIPKSSVLSLRYIDGATSGDFHLFSGQTDIARVEITIQRLKDGFFWTGRHWGKLSATNDLVRRPAQVSGSPFSLRPLWTFFGGPLQTDLAAGGYRVIATAYDKAGNSGSTAVEVSSVAGKTPVLRGRIVFSSNSNIFIVNANGSGQRQLTARRGSNFRPQLSPDGQQIAFFSTRSGNTELFVMHADGSGARQLTYSSAPHTEARPFGFLLFDWSPDGRQIVFERGNPSSGDFDIVLINTQGGPEIPLLSSPAHDYAPTFTPNGRRIVFLSNRTNPISVHAVNLDGTEVQPLASSLPDFSPFRFSPDGRKIAYFDGRIGTRRSNVIVAAPYGLRRQIVNRGYQAYNSGWSPDGKRLVMTVGIEDPYDGERPFPQYTRYLLFTANLDGSDLRQVSETPVDFTLVLSWR